MKTGIKNLLRCAKRAYLLAYSLLISFCLCFLLVFFRGFLPCFVRFLVAEKKFVTQKNRESSFLLEIIHAKLCFIVNLYTFDL